ncbi:MAG TPA: nucleotidyl transferase AbiEii/AbiGii toxin family protein [Acidimicrobiales bacterium]|nr:nucleotidyl transferase AbiEii/AbiGii toxin family protein [Acidimicrobiales bacterium]
MSGDRPPIHLKAGAGSVLARAVEALSRFPTDQPWALIGGVAVFIRLGSVTRPTADADTLARSQAELIERLVAREPATVVSGGELEVPVGDGTIEVDVMDLADDPLPGDPERRAFALARRYALETAVTEGVVVSDGESVVVDAQIPVASTAALVALKTASMVRRPHGNSPHKIGSDIHDLVRLVSSTGARTVATELVAHGALATWVSGQVHRAFGSDLGYTLLRLRTNDRSAGAQALSDAEVEATGILADELTEQLESP